MKLNVVVMALTLGAMVAPLAGAHLTNFGSPDYSTFDLTAEHCRNRSPCSADNAVSGTYRGDAVVFFGSAEFGQPIAAGLFTPGGCDSGYSANNGCRVVFGPGRSCDTEWVDDGSDPGNEAAIDDDTNGGAGYGQVPEGTWDDGGPQGTACHVDNARDGWNNFGCGHKEYASDSQQDISNTNGPWMGNTCDFVKPADSSDFTSCIVNDLVLGDDGVAGLAGAITTDLQNDQLALVSDVPAKAGDAAGTATTCALQALAFVESCHGLPAPLTGGVSTGGPCTPTPNAVQCGRDQGPDTAVFGRGKAGTAAPAESITIGSTTTTCSTGAGNPTGSGGSQSGSYGNQWVFVYSYVDDDSNAYVPTSVGWIDGDSV